MKREFVAVLDLGASKAACLVAHADPQGRVRVIGHAESPCKGVRKGAVTNLEEAARGIDGACRHAQQEAGRDIDQVVVSVGGPGVETFEARGYVPIYPRTRAITRDDVLQVVNHSRQMVIPPDREQILALPRDFRIDGNGGIQKPVGMSGGRLEVSTFLATAETAQIQNLERALGMTGRKAEMVVPQALASGIGVLTPEEIESGAAVVDIGAGGAQVAVFSKGSIAFAGCVPVGSGHISSDIAKLLKTSPEEAERLKLLGSAVAAEVQGGESVEVMQIGQVHARPMDRRVLSEIIESRMREIASMVGQQLERSGAGILPGGLVLTGGGSLLADADKLFEQVLEHNRVRLGAPRLDGGGSRPSTLGPSYAASVGLARFALDSDEDELSAVGTNGKWTEKVRTLWSLISGKA